MSFRTRRWRGSRPEHSRWPRCTGRSTGTHCCRPAAGPRRDDGLLRVHPAQHRADHGVRRGGLGGGGSRGFFQQPGDHGGDHLDVAHSSVATSMIRSLLPAGHPAVPALKQVLHGHGHLAVGAPITLLQLVAHTPDRASRLRIELQVSGVTEHETTPRMVRDGPARARSLSGPPRVGRRERDTAPHNSRPYATPAENLPAGFRRRMVDALMAASGPSLSEPGKPVVAIRRGGLVRPTVHAQSGGYRSWPGGVGQPAPPPARYPKVLTHVISRFTLDCGILAAPSAARSQASRSPWASRGGGHRPGANGIAAGLA